MNDEERQDRVSKDWHRFASTDSGYSLYVMADLRGVTVGTASDTGSTALHLGDMDAARTLHDLLADLLAEGGAE